MNDKTVSIEHLNDLEYQMYYLETLKIIINCEIITCFLSKHFFFSFLDKSYFLAPLLPCFLGEFSQLKVLQEEYMVDEKSLNIFFFFVSRHCFLALLANSPFGYSSSLDMPSPLLR